MATATWSPPRVGGAVWFPSSPEQQQDARGATPSGDVFAVALMLADLLARTPLRETLWVAVSAGGDAVVSVLERARPGLHPSVQAALLAALDAKAARRPKDADRLAKLLRDADWSEVDATPAPRPERPLPPATSAAPEPTPAKARIVESRVVVVASTPPSAPQTSAPAMPAPTSATREPPLTKAAPQAALTLVDEAPPTGRAARPVENATLVDEDAGPTDTLPLAAPSEEGDAPPTAENVAAAVEDLGAATVPLPVAGAEAGGRARRANDGAMTLAYEDHDPMPSNDVAPSRRGVGAVTLDLDDAASFGALGGARRHAGPHTIAPSATTMPMPVVRGIPAPPATMPGAPVSTALPQVAPRPSSPAVSSPPTTTPIVRPTPQADHVRRVPVWVWAALGVAIIALVTAALVR